MGCGSSRVSLGWSEMRQLGLQRSTSFDVLMIADQDKDSKNDSDNDGKVDNWISYLVVVRVTRHGAPPNHKYKCEVIDKVSVVVNQADKSGRGAEFSSLCYFNGKLLTCDDRTGKIMSLTDTDPGDGRRIELKTEYVCPDADGSDPNAGFKAEWMIVKDGKLYCGSHGRPESDPKARNDRMRWVKVISPDGQIKHENWADRFDVICRRLNVDPKKGYVTHESALWSDIHKKFFFYPRRISNEAWAPDKDPHNGSNILVAVDEDFGVSISRTALSFKPDLGTADMDFVPCSGESELVVVRTLEMDDRMDSFLSIVDLNGHVLMPETRILKGLKLEGLAVQDVKR